jgi:hypothetical protein
VSTQIGEQSASQRHPHASQIGEADEDSTNSRVLIEYSVNSNDLIEVRMC